MAALVERARPGALDRLRLDPLGELDSWSDIALVMVAEESGKDRCSVAGSYEPNPPTLVVAKAASVRRRGFTALHELGHHLQQTDLDLGAATFNYSEPELYQEEACDAFAAHVLLPDEKLRPTIGPRGPVAQDIVTLFAENSSASREACCVWAARHLRGAGAVVLLDNVGAVLFAAPRSFFPPARGSDQSGTPLVEAALNRRSGVVTRDETYVRYRTGSHSDSLYGQAAWFDDEYLVAIVTSDNVGWREFAPPRPDTSRFRPGTWWTCETCEETFTSFEPPCSTCKQPKCESDHCGCTVAKANKNRTCTKCFLSLHPSRFDGASVVCRDCE
ncbi:ImmA/IrrE family metallo-endopeptidase [Lentzea sp. NPDC051838]|uniref:ImmA/IrrE family metallo-endopeptidase n=1 Tax=Lentzea sp. NPDC051838 TaxID=3154849 RepID=UPI0034182300